LLESWDGKDRAWLTERLGGLCRETSRETRTDHGALDREASEILEAFLASDLPDRLAGVERLGGEVPLLVRSEESSRVFRGNIDLVYRNGDGELVVADYKTDRDTDPSELRDSYAPQLAIYADAVQRVFGLPERPRMELWLLRAGRVLPLDGPPQQPGGDDGPRQLALW
jgi:ATP-dependent exoDNAse (exonuclease V) beta subunit